MKVWWCDVHHAEASTDDSVVRLCWAYEFVNAEPECIFTMRQLVPADARIVRVGWEERVRSALLKTCRVHGVGGGCIACEARWVAVFDALTEGFDEAMDRAQAGCGAFNREGGNVKRRKSEHAEVYFIGGWPEPTRWQKIKFWVFILVPRRVWLSKPFYWWNLLKAWKAGSQ